MEDDTPAEVQFVVLAPERGAHGPDAVVVTANCGHRAWASPSSRRMLAGATAPYTVCIDCYEPDEDDEMAPVPGVQSELEQLFGAAAADQMLAELADPKRRVHMIRTAQRRQRGRHRR